jgi:choline kinase
MSAGVLLLGAGLGARLRPLTDDRPKCVVEVAGEPLAARVLRQFAERGVRRATVVIGHFAERARELIGERIGGLEIRFVENREYATTNTMYSTLLGIEALRGGGFLVEGDIVADDAVIDRLIAADPARSHWAVDAWTPAHTGSRLRDDGAGAIVGQEIWRAATTGPTDRLWKSAGMLRLSAAGAQALAETLRHEADAGQRSIYYDDVIGRHLSRFDLRILDLAGAPWVEIDDLDDMAQARARFPRGRGAAGPP